MTKRLLAGCFILTACWLSLAQQTADERPPMITTHALPKASPDKPYEARLDASGGVPLFDRGVSEGKLPDRLAQGSESGVISGVPSAPGEMPITITVRGSSRPPATVNREFSFSAADSFLPEQNNAHPSLRILTDTLPEASPNKHYEAKLEASGGVLPLHWRISEGRLPDGLELDSESGVILGVPSEAGKIPIIITVTDSARPAATVSRQFTFSTVATLSLEWKNYPQVNSDGISGSIAVSNGTKETFDQTVIIMAVNEYGKAFALGYQHFDLKPNTLAQEITFGSTLPHGQYVVHADAIAEVAAKHAIYRNRLQTNRPLPVTAP